MRRHMSNRGNIYGGKPARERRSVEVISYTAPDGLVTPLEIIWDDGRRFKVDHVIDRRYARSLKTGGTGMRYQIAVGQTETYLYFEDASSIWSVEAKVMGADDWGA